MQYIALPLEVLNSEKFLSLSMQQRMFLIDLYVMFLDCQTFTVDIKRPTEYRQKPHASLILKLQVLIKAGFIKVVGRQKVNEYTGRRVFSFCYPAIELDGEHDSIFDDELNDALVSLDSNYELRA